MLQADSDPKRPRVAHGDAGKRTTGPFSQETVFFVNYAMNVASKKIKFDVYKTI